MSGLRDSRYQSRDGDNEYLRLSSQVPTHIQFVHKSGRSLQRLANLIGTRKEPRNALQQLEAIIQDTKNKIHETKSMIDRLGRMDGGSPAEVRMRKQEQRKYSQDLEAAIEVFEKGMSLAVQKEREAVRNERAGSHYANQGYDEYGNENASLIEDERRQQEQMVAQDVNMRTAYIREREEGIKHLESEMREVHEIFTDVADLVQDQGRTLENIESNMTVTYDRVDNGVQQLTKASRHQKSARKKSLWLLLIVVIVAGVLAAIIVPTLKHKNKT